TGSRYWPTGGPGTPGHPVSANTVTLNQGYHEAPSVLPDDKYHIQQMSTCNMSPLQSTICLGDVIRVYAQYNNTSGFPILYAMGFLGGTADANQPDSDGDGTIDACDSSNTDGDTFLDSAEGFIGTDAGVKCAATSAANDEPLPDKWPMDFDDNQKALL